MFHKSLLLLTIAVPSFALTTQEVLAKMDQSAASFSSMSANLRKVSHTEVINDNTEESGTIILKKTGPKQLAALIDFTKPDPRTVTFRAKKAEVFSPKLN